MMGWDIPEQLVNHIIQSAFEEDLAETGDITSMAALSANAEGKAVLRLKAEGVIAGLPLLGPVFHMLDPTVRITLHAADGEKRASGSGLATMNGNLRSILTAERTALNFLQRLSGIATLTRAFSDRISHTRTRILDTRKTTPGLRLLEKYAVRQGGGENHRIGLFDMVLIKDNHIDANGGIGPAIERCLNYLNANGLQIPIEVETRSLDEVREAIKYPVQRIMLDNMSANMMKNAVEMIQGCIKTEASGNVSLETVAEIAGTGVDYISVGALTHSARALDMSLFITTE